MVLSDGARLVIAGAAIGLAAGVALTRVLASEVSDISAADPWTFAMVVAIVAVAGMAACVPSARRAMNLDPTIALRRE